jgi:hypothetical protein
MGGSGDKIVAFYLFTGQWLSDMAIVYPQVVRHCHVQEQVSPLWLWVLVLPSAFPAPGSAGFLFAAVP